jgi:hypothetical protein
MTERKREVVAEFTTYYVCDEHGWDYTNVDDDVCPVCMGESLERDRIIKLLEVQLAEQKVGMFYADAIRTSILIIKGESN